MEIHTIAKPAKATSDRYHGSVGRRKTAIARVRVRVLDSGTTHRIMVNGKDFKEYFALKKCQQTVLLPLETLSVKHYDITALVCGGGMTGQAEAVRLGIARGLVSYDVSGRSRLKALGFLKRDPRMVERKKPGLRKARRPQQWRKR